jgi:HlyD family secretion protein
MTAPQPPAAPSNTPAPTPDADLADLLGEPATRPWYRHPVLWVAVVAVLVLSLGLWWWISSRAAQTAPRFTTVSVGRGDITLVVTAN